MSLVLIYFLSGAAVTAFLGWISVVRPLQKAVKNYEGRVQDILDNLEIEFPPPPVETWEDVWAEYCDQGVLEKKLAAEWQVLEEQRKRAGEHGFLSSSYWTDRRVLVAELTVAREKLARLLLKVDTFPRVKTDVPPTEVHPETDVPQSGEKQA